MPVLVAVLLVAHALIHLSFVSPRPPARDGGPAWPFALDRSRVLARVAPSASALHTLGITLLALVLGGYAVGAIAALGIGGSTLFAWGVGLGSVGSLGMLVVFFHSWLTLGIAIDVALLVAVLAGWYPR